MRSEYEGWGWTRNDYSQIWVNMFIIKSGVAPLRERLSAVLCEVRVQSYITLWHFEGSPRCLYNIVWIIHYQTQFVIDTFATV